jgi:hypothetical protein
MGGQTVTVTLTVDEVQALSAYTRQQQALDKLEAKAKQIKSEPDPLQSLKKGGLSVISIFRDAAIELIGISTAVGGIMALANQIKAEYQNLLSIQKNASGAQLEYAPALEASYQNTGQLMSVNEFDKRVRDEAARIGQSPTKMVQAVGNALGAAAPDTSADVIKTIESTGEIMKTFPTASQEAIDSYTGTINDMMKQFNYDVKTAIGLTLQTAKQNRSVTNEALAKSVMPAIAMVSQYDASASQSSAFVSLISQYLMDDTGDETKTAARTVASELQARLPKEKDLPSRIARVQNDPALYKSIMEGGMIDGKKFTPMIFGRGAAEPVFKQLFNKESGAAKKYAEFQKSMGTEQDWLKLAPAMQAEQRSSPVIQQAALKRKIDAANEQASLVNITGGTGAISREGLDTVLSTAGYSDIAKKMALLKYEVNTSLGKKGQINELASQLEEAALDLQAPRGSESDLNSRVSMLDFRIKERKPELSTPEGRKTADELFKLIDQLRALEEDAKSANVSSAATDAVIMAADIRNKLKAGSPLTEADNAALNQGNSALRGLTANRPEGAAKAIDNANETFSKLLQEISVLNKSISANSRATDENTKSTTKPGSTPNVRPQPVTSLQSTRAK